MNRTLWVVQSLLALIFALASSLPKLLLPPEMLPMPIPIPRALMLFVGVAELAGALGLVLPGLLRIWPILTPLAAVGLVLLMIGAVALTVSGGIAMAVVPLVTGLLAAFVAYGRWRPAPHRAR